MSGVAVAAGRDLGGVKRINRAHWNDDDSQRSSWLAALRQHLHLKPAELEPLLAISEATMARRVREQVALDLVASERLDRLVEVISLAYGVFEDPASTEAWLKAPHPLLHQVSPLQHCRTAIGAGQVRRLLQAIEQGAPV